MLEKPRQQPHTPEHVPVEYFEKMFEINIMNYLLEEFEEALYEIGFEDAEVESIRKNLQVLHSAEEIKGALAIPEENRIQYLSRIKEQTKSPDEFVDALVATAKKYGFTIGYHVSATEIPGTTIIGRESGHRDDDLGRAYYSTDYKNLFLKKRGNFLYVVRAETGPGSAHRQDNDNSWGRASALAIVGRLDLKKMLDSVNKQTRESLRKDEAALDGAA